MSTSKGTTKHNGVRALVVSEREHLLDGIPISVQVSCIQKSHGIFTSFSVVKGRSDTTSLSFPNPE
jgi:hypothetical protein